MPIILATQEADIRRIRDQEDHSSKPPWANSPKDPKDPIAKKPSQK
jgi:hypothetical protein